MANTTINFTIRALDGTVVPLTQFQIESGRLNTGEIPDVMPATTSFMTDANGQATVSLTVTEAPYYISKLDGTTDKVISYKFFVPESISPISGEMLYVDLGKNSKFYNDKSVAALIEAKIVAVNARNQVQLYIASNIATKLAIDAVALQVQNEHVAIQVLHDSTQAIVNTAVTTINTNTAAQVANVKVITDPWLGTKSVAPTVRNDSTPLQNGDEYFDTVVMGRMAYFNGTWYVSGVSNVTNTLFSGNGITTGFVLPVDPHGINNTVVYIDSVYQQKSTYSVSGTNITFSTAPITGTNNIDVTVAAAVVIGTLPASGVTFTPSGTLSSTNVQSAITELVTDLAASSGSSMVGYLPPGIGAVSRTVQSKLRESVSVLDFGAVGDGVTDDTVAIQLAINTMIAIGGNLHFPYGIYRVTQITSENSSYNFSMSSDGAVFIGISSSLKQSVIELINSVDFHMTGVWRIDANNNTNYKSGFSIRALSSGDQKTTRVNVDFMTVKNAMQAVSIGEFDNDRQCSEISFQGFNSFLCPVCVYLGGSQTVVSFSNSNLVSEPNTSFPGAVESVVWQEGGVIEITGGEFVIAASTTGKGIKFNPSSSTLYSNPYGMIKLNNVLTEVSSQFLQVSNTRVLLTPDSSQSHILISGAGGYSTPGILSQDYFFILDNTYAGVIDVSESNFYTTSVRSGYNISGTSALVKIKCDKTSFGKNFKHWLGGIFSGNLIHDLQPVVNASGLGVTIPATATNLIFLNNVTIGQMARYSSGYDISTGLYRATHDFSRLEISVTIVGVPGVVPGGDIFIKRDSVIVAFGYFDGVGKLDATLFDVIGGTYIEVILQPLSATLFDLGVYQSLKISGATN